MQIQAKPMNQQTAQLEAVAAAALAWNRARLHRIAVTKQHAEALRWFTVRRAPPRF